MLNLWFSYISYIKEWIFPSTILLQWATHLVLFSNFFLVFSVIWDLPKFQALPSAFFLAFQSHTVSCTFSKLEDQLYRANICFSVKFISLLIFLPEIATKTAVSANTEEYSVSYKCLSLVIWLMILKDYHSFKSRYVGLERYLNIKDKAYNQKCETRNVEDWR